MRNEIRKAEYHLNRQAPRPVTLAMTVTAVVLLILTWASKPVHANLLHESLAQPTSSMQAGGCSVHLKSLQFSGTFLLKKTTKEAGERMRFVIGQPEGSAPGTAIAQIWAGDECRASCSTIDLGDLTGFAESTDGSIGVASMPIALDLQCRSEKPGVLSTHVAVLWGATVPGRTPAGLSSTSVRFGSWVEGYSQAAMRVDVDQLAARGEMNRPLGEAAAHPIAQR